MKTNVELLGEKLGRTLARMTAAADKGDRDLALAEMRNARRELTELRRAGGLPDLQSSELTRLEVSWKNMIEGRVRAAKRAV